MDQRDQRHEDLISRHNNRREVPWTPYHERVSEGQLKITDDGAVVTVVMEVAGLGTLVITANARYSAILHQFKWDSSAELRARIDDQR